MPTSRKQKSKARKDKEAEMLSDLENMIFCLVATTLKEKIASLGIRLEGLKVLVTMH